MTDPLAATKLPNGLWGYDLSFLKPQDLTAVGAIERRYSTPQGYLKTSYLVRAMSVSASAVQAGAVTRSDPAQYGSWVEGMVNLGVFHFGTQFYWLGQQMGEAFKHTEPPRDNDAIFAELPMPFPAYTLLLPKGLLRVGSDGHVMAITQCLFGAEFSKRYFQQVLHSVGGAQPMWFCVGYCFFENVIPNRPVITTFYFRGWGDSQMGDAIFRPGPSEQYLPADYELHMEPDEIDRQAPKAIAQLAVNSSIMITTLPTLTEESEALGKRRSGKSGKKRKEQLLSPRWVGQHYRYAHRDTPGGGGGSKSMHFRRGHWRLQRYGSGRKEVKRIWIEPTIINKPEER